MFVSRCMTQDSRSIHALFSIEPKLKMKAGFLNTFRLLRLYALVRSLADAESLSHSFMT